MPCRHVITRLALYVLIPDGKWPSIVLMLADSPQGLIITKVALPAFLVKHQLEVILCGNSSLQCDSIMVTQNVFSKLGFPLETFEWFHKY